MARKKKDDNVFEDTVIAEEVSVKEDTKDSVPSVFDEIKNKTLTKRAKKKNIARDRDRMVPVVSFVDGGLTYKSSRTGLKWRFRKFGDIEEIDLGELITMRASAPKFLEKPWLLILDDEVVEFFGLTEKYKNIILPQHFDSLFKLPLDRFCTIIENAPEVMKHLIVAKARELMSKNELNSLELIRMIDKLCGVNLIEEMLDR